MTCLHEARRMLPVLTDGSNRTAQQDVTLGGHDIPKGTMVWLFFNGLFNSTATWGDPDVYRPVGLCTGISLLPACMGVGCMAEHHAQLASRLLGVLRLLAQMIALMQRVLRRKGGQRRMQNFWCPPQLAVTVLAATRRLPPAPSRSTRTALSMPFRCVACSAPRRVYILMASHWPSWALVVCTCHVVCGSRPHCTAICKSSPWPPSATPPAGGRQGEALDALQRRAARLRGPEPGAHELRHHGGHAVGPLPAASGRGGLGRLSALHVMSLLTRTCFAALPGSIRMQCSHMHATMMQALSVQKLHMDAPASASAPQ